MMEDYINQKEKVAYEKLEACKEVKKTVETPGWTKIIQPIIEKRIGSRLGEKRENGIWMAGKVQEATSNDECNYHIGYLNALMDLSNDIRNYINNIDIKENHIKHLEEIKSKGMRVPLADGGRYAPTQDRDES